ncbi:hypothetical protein HMPREF3038_00274 [Akkermansia sp. KLE1797]|nr:hypothetical protein HMPREF3038_00274 [Akkermansia sp. KLE1797]
MQGTCGRRGIKTAIHALSVMPPHSASNPAIPSVEKGHVRTIRNRKENQPGQ